ncbi:hypothetical protein TUM12370_36960 [Salmonella enterica subsp. enterica serovar Choleraesuis]|nr:hypothetical protein TUM12370_36960 [Salmonella enterica subsp. enterica serovar Choleraesuis]
MDGLKSDEPSAREAGCRFCDDYKRGFIIGYAHHVKQVTGEESLAARKAGALTRLYALDKELMAEFFYQHNNRSAVNSFNEGYEGGF